VSPPAARSSPPTLVVGRLSGGPGADVFEVVRDWTATELLSPSLWLDCDQPDDVPVLTLVDADGAATHPAEEWLARQAVVGLRIAVLQVFPADDAREQVGGAARALVDRIGLGSRALVNVLVPATPTTTIPAEAALSARPNVLLQARDAQGPGVPSRPVSPAELAQHAAGGLATVGGLWAGMAEAPFDGAPVWPGQQVVVARAYARTLDSQEVLGELSREVHRAEGTLPRPRTPLGDRLTQVPEAQARPTAEVAAHSLVDAHAQLTRFSAPPPFQPQPRRAIRLLAAVRMFLSFLWAAIRNAPQAWVTALVHRAAQGISSAATSALFGQESAYEVVVLGVRPSDEQETEPEDDVTALIEQVQQLMSRLSPGTEFTTVDTSTFWGDMTTVGVSLADGSAVPPQVQMPMLGVDRQVLDRPELIAPRPDEAAHRLPVGALPDVGGLAVEPDDPYLALQANRLLTEQLQRPDSAPSGGPGYQVFDTARNSLWSWVERQRSYAWKVGLELAQELERARQTLAEAVRAAGDTGGTPPRDVLDTQRRTRNFVLLALGVAVLALALVIGLVVGSVLGIRVGAVLAVLVALVWLGVSVRVFLQRQRALFGWLHQRDESRRHREWAQTCTVHVAGEVHRLGVLYRQSRLWAGVLGSVVHDPFGGIGATAAGSGYPIGLSGSLPLSTAVGAASFSPAEHSQLVHLARREQLGIGWLGRQLQQRVEAALAARSQRYGRPEHQAAWSDSGYSPHGPLAELVATLGTPADREQAAAAADARLVTWLTGVGSRQGVEWSLAAVHPRVTVTAGAISGTVTGAEFLSPLLAAVGNLEPHGFSATGAAALADRVDRTSLAVVGVPVPDAAAGLLRTAAGTGARSMDRFVARLDQTRQLNLDHVAQFSAAEPEVALGSWYPEDPIDVRM
jgi:hypothetical protein